MNTRFLIRELIFLMFITGIEQVQWMSQYFIIVFCTYSFMPYTCRHGSTDKSAFNPEDRLSSDVFFLYKRTVTIIAFH